MNKIDQYAKLLAEGFIDDPGVKIQLRGLKRSKELFELQCKGELEAFMQNGYVTVDDSGKGLLIGYSTKELSGEKLIECMQKSSVYILQAITEVELERLQKNIVSVSEITQEDWYEKYLGKREVFVIQSIVIDKSSRGTGIFRKLLEPILKKYEEAHIPMVLQTHNPENVPQYEHIGFKVMEQASSPQIDLTCFCLLKA